MPFGIAPAALHGMAHADGECATARAAATAGVLQVVSTVASRSIEDVAAAAPAGPRWFQLYVQRDRAISRDLVQRAEAAGYGAIALTVDLPVLGYRDEVLRTDFDPGRGAYANLPKRAVWDGDIDEVLDFRSVGLTWDDLAMIRDWSSLPLVLKGILTAEDARLAVEHGAAAVWVSNHGGRQLDRVAAPIDVLAEIVDAVDGRAEVYLDGGVRRGPDVAIALGNGCTRGVRRPPVPLRAGLCRRSGRRPRPGDPARGDAADLRAARRALACRTHPDPRRAGVGFRRYPQVDDDRAARRSVARREGGRAGHRNRRRPPCRDGRAGRAREPPLPRRGCARDQRRRVRPAVPRAGRARECLSAARYPGFADPARRRHPDRHDVRRGPSPAADALAGERVHARRAPRVRHAGAPRPRTPRRAGSGRRPALRRGTQDRRPRDHPALRARPLRPGRHARRRDDRRGRDGQPAHDQGRPGAPVGHRLNGRPRRGLHAEGRVRADQHRARGGRAAAVREPAQQWRGLAPPEGPAGHRQPAAFRVDVPTHRGVRGGRHEMPRTWIRQQLACPPSPVPSSGSRSSASR